MAGLVIDNFAGGGGASTGIEAALGRPIDIAINHDPEAVALHAANHPATRHYCQSVWRADPLEVSGGRPVGLAWFSPDCKHFSKAKGGKPVEKNIRDLAWVVVLWARRVRPRVIMLENVEEFRDWGPLIEADDGKLKPCPLRKGLTYRRWKRELVKLGYRVEERELRDCDYGAPTIRKRLFVVARCDGKPIVWPAPTHGPGLIPYRMAAECIDWSLPCPSIFTRKRPLAEATLRRIARGVMRYVVNAAEPFIVPITHTGDLRGHPVSEPLRTITTAHRGEQALVAPTLVSVAHGDSGGRREHRFDEPTGVVQPGGGKYALVAAFLAQHNTGMVGHGAQEPVSTIVGKGCTQGVVAAALTKFKGTCPDGQPVDAPLATVQAGGQHHALVAAFLQKYYGTGQDPRLAEPLHTVTTKDRFGVVTVEIDGQAWTIADIGMRMLTPRELFNAQGFPADYVIAPVVDGKPLTKTAQIRMCGNSVSPPVAKALVRANVAAVSLPREATA